MRAHTSAFWLGLSTIVVALCAAHLCKARETDAELLEAIRKFDTCSVGLSTSFVFAEAYPPKSISEFKQKCQRQADAIKCVKEKTRGAAPLVRRGLLAYSQSRQKFNKKFCSNFQSETTRKYVEDSKCLMENRFEHLKKVHEDYVMTLVEIYKKNYNDSATELRQFCCLFHSIKSRHLSAHLPECPNAGETIGEMAQAVVPRESEMICEDEEKLAKVCPKLEQLKLPAAGYNKRQGASAATLGVYIIATLGEPSDGTASLT